MYIRSSTVAGLVAAIAVVQAQSTTSTAPTTSTTGFTESQVTKASLDLASYASAVATAPNVQSILSQLSTAVPAATLASVVSNNDLFYGAPTGVLAYSEIVSLATASPSASTTPAWVTALPSDVRSAVEGLQTSVIQAEASILRHDFSLNGAMPTGAAGYGLAVGAVAGAVGFAAAML